MFGRGKRELIANLLERSGVLRLLENSPFTDSLLVLSYNRVLHARDCPFDRGAISANPDQFYEQASYFKSRFQVTGLPELLEHVESGRPLTGFRTMITFDDGYIDHRILSLGDCRLQATSEEAFGFGRVPFRFISSVRRILVVVSERYAKNAGGAFSLKYHVVWCPKYRRSVLVKPVDARLKALEGDPTICVSEIVNGLKGFTSHELREEFPCLRSRLPTLWSRSYYAGSVGSVSEAVVRIENQKGK